jgi:hypothetical protein
MGTRQIYLYSLSFCGDHFNRLSWGNEEGAMKKPAERFRITVSDGGLEIHSSEGKGLSFTAAEALMLLDLLRNEEERLKRLAEQASPLPLQIRF